MLAAEAKLAYSGREVTQFADGRQSEQIVKCHPRLGLRREFLRPPGDLFVDDLRRSWFLSVRRGRMFERSSRRAERERFAVERIDLPVHYDGKDVVAGREAHIVRVGRADGGPARRFWIDAQTGLRLKTEEIDPRGNVTSFSYFLSLDLHPKLTPQDFERPSPPPGVRIVPERGESYDSLREAQKHVPFSLRAPGYLPPGYRLRVVHVTRFQGHPVVSQRYTNGLSSFTLFQTNAEMPPHRQKSSSRDARIRTWRDGSLAFALIGSLSEDAMRRVADSVR